MKVTYLICKDFSNCCVPEHICLCCLTQYSQTTKTTMVRPLKDWLENHEVAEIMARWIGFQRDCFSASLSDHMSPGLIGILSEAAWHLKFKFTHIPNVQVSTLVENYFKYLCACHQAVMQFLPGHRPSICAALHYFSKICSTCKRALSRVRP